MPSLNIASPEELHGGAAVQRAVLYLRLAGEVVRGVDGRHHAVHGEEGGQVGGVAGDQDQGEEPPDPACSSRCCYKPVGSFFGNVSFIFPDFSSPFPPACETCFDRTIKNLTLFYERIRLLTETFLSYSIYRIRSKMW